MKKGQRHELKMIHYRRRIKLLGIEATGGKNLYALRSHSTPCSCGVCRGRKFKRAVRKRVNLILTALDEATQVHNGERPGKTMEGFLKNY